MKGGCNCRKGYVDDVMVKADHVGREGNAENDARQGGGGGFVLCHVPLPESNRATAAGRLMRVLLAWFVVDPFIIQRNSNANHGPCLGSFAQKVQCTELTLT